MQLIINNNKIISYHTDDQDVLSLYQAEIPSAESILVPDDTDIFLSDKDGFKLVSNLKIKNPWPQIRERRNFLLKESDWTQMPDSPLKESDIFIARTYRQALRDLPKNQSKAKSFSQIVWPPKPDFI